jgi:hypothetical protein
VQALLIPADLRKPLTLATVGDRSADISDLLGGVLLAEPVALFTDTHDPLRLYQADVIPPLSNGIPENSRAAEIAATLSLVEPAAARPFLGDIIITGWDAARCLDSDIPFSLLEQTVAAGLFSSGPRQSLHIRKGT